VQLDAQVVVVVGTASVIQASLEEKLGPIDEIIPYTDLIA